MEHRLLRKHLQLKRRNSFSKKKQEWKKKKKNEKLESEVTLKWTTLNLLSTEARKIKIFTKENRPFSNENFSTIFLGVLASARTTGKGKKKKEEK